MVLMAFDLVIESGVGLFPQVFLVCFLMFSQQGHAGMLREFSAVCLAIIFHPGLLFEKDRRSVSLIALEPCCCLSCNTEGEYRLVGCN